MLPYLLAALFLPSAVLTVYAAYALGAAMVRDFREAGDAP